MNFGIYHKQIFTYGKQLAFIVPRSGNIKEGDFINIKCGNYKTIRKVNKNKSNNTLLVTLPTDAPLQSGDIVYFEKNEF